MTYAILLFLCLSLLPDNRPKELHPAPSTPPRVPLVKQFKLPRLRDLKKELDPLPEPKEFTGVSDLRVR